ncbi:hypothetical protein NS183_05075 [Microbacterium testaceum]|nr:hypothetical protein NS183_05075 [Microbacterium testaceum]
MGAGADPCVHIRDSTTSAANFTSDGTADVFDVALDAPTPDAKLALPRRGASASLVGRPGSATEDDARDEGRAREAAQHRDTPD